jgi:heptosyltransferase-2/heptosyltransferase-3
LVIRPDHLGDLLFITPTLRALRQRCPQSHVTALIGPWGAPILADNPHVDAVISLAFPGFTREARSSLWEPYVLLYRWSRRLRGQYDLALILRFDHWWGAWLAYGAGIPIRVGYDVPEVAPFLNHVVPYEPGRHEVLQNLRLLEWGGMDGCAPDIRVAGRRPALEFPIAESAHAWARTLLRVRSAIAIHPGAGAPVKLWQASRWAAVADALSQETGAQILLTGSRSERALSLDIAAKMHAQAWVVAGETTLGQLAAIFTRCRLVLGVDSGPLHLAVAVGTPTVHLYGPVDRAAFGPWGDTARHRALVSAWPCIPCNRLDYAPQVLAHHLCVREISVQQVLTGARKVLAA